MLFQKFTLGPKTQTEPEHRLKHQPSGKHGDCSMGWLGLWSAQADALMTQAERIKTINLRPGKKVYTGNINCYVTRPTKSSRNNTRRYRSVKPWAFPKLGRDGGQGTSEGTLQSLVILRVTVLARTTLPIPFQASSCHFHTGKSKRLQWGLSAFP